MADYTATESGNWSTITWSPDATPGDGDTADTGAWDVVVDVNTTVGGSPASSGTDAVTISSGGSLTIAEDVTLTARGDITLTSTTSLTMSAGSTLTIDSTQAADPAAAKYLLRTGSSHYAVAKLICNGTQAKPCTVQGHASGGGISINTSFITGQIQATYTTFKKLTGGSTYGIRNLALDAPNQMIFTNCVFDDCKQIYIMSYSGAASDGEVEMTNCVFKNSVSANSMYLYVNGVTHTLVTLDTCYFDKKLQIDSCTNVTIQNCVFEADTAFAGGAWDTFSNNLVRKTDDGAINHFGASITNCYYITDYASSSNPHYINCRVDSPVISGCLFQLAQNGNNSGDCIIPQAEVSTGGTVSNCITLPNDSGTTSGVLVTLGGQAGDAWSINHNTMCWKGLEVGETYTGHEDQLTSFKSNIVWHGTSGNMKVHDQAEVTTDLAYVASLDYNCGWNLSAGDSAKGYDGLQFSSGSPGANDLVDVDPGFVDSTRNLATWDTALGGAGTIANALEEFAKVDNIAGDYDSNYTVAAAVTWVKAGFAPTTTSLQNAGHDAVTIGAVEGSFPATGGGSVSAFLGPILGI